MSDAALTACAALACAGAALAGCGEKEEITSAPEGSQAPQDDLRGPERWQQKARPSATPSGARPSEKPRTRPRAGAAARSPEDQPGGAGDEIPARAQALITGRRGRLSPRVVRVPPFIAVRVELRSADGRRYRLSGAGKTLRARRPAVQTRATFDGLRPGRRLLHEGHRRARGRGSLGRTGPVGGVC
ncbi:MAG: hypothetical protein WKF40_05095 [Thermoleophilaceae bacterium]